MEPATSSLGSSSAPLSLRSETGASIVDLERAGITTVNPGPDEELLAGDQVLLLGKAGQLEKARALLLQPRG